MTDAPKIAQGPVCYLSPGSPPSSYAIAAVIEGEPGGWAKVAVGTAQRSLFILPGLALAGIRGPKLLAGSLFGSVGITLALFGFYHLRRRGVIAAWNQNAAG